jgi:intracellular septation protein
MTPQDAGLAPKTAKAGSNVLVELGPAILFMVVYNVARRQDEANAIFIGTGVFMAATLAALAYALFVQKRVPPMLLVTAAIVLIFGGLTLWLKNELFVFLKPTIINLLFAAAIFGGLLLGRNPLKLLLSEALTLPEPVWRTLALRFGCFYVFLAGLNEVIWRSFSEAFWVNFKVLGVLPISIGFMLLNAPLIVRHMKSDPQN